MQRRKKKILWIDDRPAYLVPSVDEVENETNAIVKTASTASIGLAYLVRDEYDLVITDVVLPDKHLDVACSIFECEFRAGLVFARLLRNGTFSEKLECPRIRNTPIIIYSSFQPSEQSSDMEGGSIISIQKSRASKKILIKEIRKLLG